MTRTASTKSKVRGRDKDGGTSVHYRYALDEIVPVDFGYLVLVLVVLIGLKAVSMDNLHDCGARECALAL